MNRSLLIVENDNTQRETLSRRFIRAGYKVVAVHHPRLALEAATFRPFQVALLAQRSPEMEGLVLAQRLQGLQWGVQIVLLTDQTHPALKSQAEKVGIYACLKKPRKMAQIDDAANIACDDYLDAKSICGVHNTELEETLISWLDRMYQDWKAYGDEPIAHDWIVVGTKTGADYMDAPERSIRLLIADDHECVRDSLRIIFENTDIKVVGEASNSRAALLIVQEHDLDVALLDCSLPGGDGFELLRQMATSAPQVAVVIYSSNNREHHISRARQLGAKGWLVKGVTAERLREAIRLASAGQTLWDPVPTCNGCTPLHTPLSDANTNV